MTWLLLAALEIQKQTTMRKICISVSAEGQIDATGSLDTPRLGLLYLHQQNLASALRPPSTMELQKVPLYYSAGIARWMRPPSPYKNYRAAFFP